MRMRMRTPLAASAATLLAVAAIVAISGHGGGARAGSDGGMAAMLIDMDPGGAPANTATSLGSNETCARIDVNGLLDADEDNAPETITVDVTATGIPPANAMIGYSYELEHDQAALTVQSVDSNYLLMGNPGSILFGGSDPVPDGESPHDNVWKGAALDLGVTAGESGSGVLDRLTISTDAGAGTGDYHLSLAVALHIDSAAGAHLAENATVDSNGDTVPDKIPNVAKISVNKDCTTAPPTTPSPSPAPTTTDTPATATPTPAPTPTPGTATPTPEPSGTPAVPAKGDDDCDGDVDTVDALKTLRYVAALDVSQTEPCTDLGQTLAAGIVTNVMGDMDCDGDVDAVDAMRILRYVASLANNLPDGCPAIGT